MTDPTVVTLNHHPELDRYWIDENLEAGRKRLADIPARYTEAVATVPEIREWVGTLVEGAAELVHRRPWITRGPSLLVLGPVGTGKTFQAWGAVRALAVSGAGFSCSFAAAADLYAALRPRHGIDSEAEFERYARAGVLILDDIGAAKVSEWTEEQNYRLINYRYEHELPTLITSNLLPKDLSAQLGERVTSRLAEMTSRVVLEGADRRRAAA